MNARFHSAPGHSMETTLTINIPAPDRLRAAKSEKPTEKQKDANIKEEDVGLNEKEDEILRKDDKEPKEREKLERERKTQADKGISYKDKFQKMREKYDKVSVTHETGIRELELLNVKIKKLQSENDLLLDAMFLADTALYDRYFPSGPDIGPPPIGHPPAPAPGISLAHPPYSSRHGSHHVQEQDQHLAPPMMATSSSGSSIHRFVDQSGAPPLRPSQIHAQTIQNGSRREHHEPAPKPQPHPFYVYPPREHAEERTPQELPSHRGHRGQHLSHAEDIYPGAPGQHPPPSHRSIAPPRIIRSPSYEMELGLRLQDLLDRRDRLSREEDIELRELLALNPPPTLPNSNNHLPPPRYGHGVPMPPPNTNGYPHNSLDGRGQLPPPPSHDRHSGRAPRSSRSSRSSARRAARAEDVEMDIRTPHDQDAEADMSLGGPVHLDVDIDSLGRGDNVRRGESSVTGESLSHVPHWYTAPPVSGTPRPMAALEHPDDMPPPSGYRSQSGRQRQERDGEDARVAISASRSSPDFDEGEGEGHPDPVGNTKRRRPSDLDIVMSEDEGSPLGGTTSRDEGHRYGVEEMEIEHRVARSRHEGP